MISRKVRQPKEREGCAVKHIIDLQTVVPAELEGLWQRETQLWRERLFWDVSDRFAVFSIR